MEKRDPNQKSYGKKEKGKKILWPMRIRSLRQKEKMSALKEKQKKKIKLKKLIVV
jgi:hypothetical protein